MGNGDGKEDVGCPDVVVVEKIGDVGLKVIGIENPSAVRDGDAELMFFVAFTVQRDEAQALLSGVLEKSRAGNGLDRRRLVVVSVEGAECPANFRNGDGGAEARADGGLGDGRSGASGKIAFREPRGPRACGECEPGKGFEFVVEVEGFQMGGRMFGIGDGGRHGWRKCERIEDGSEELVIGLIEADESDLQVVLFVVGGEGGLTSDVSGTPVFRAGDGIVVGIAGVVAAVVVVERRNRGQETRIESMDPTEEDAGIGLVLAIAQADAGRVLTAAGTIFYVVGIWIVRDLIIVAPG